MTLSANRPTGVYSVGSRIRWIVQRDPSINPPVAYVVKRGGLTEIDRGTLQFEGGRAIVESTLPEPGTLLLEVHEEGEGGQVFTAGAVVAPDEIQPAAPPPDDFEKFWQRQRIVSESIPLNPRIENERSGRDGIDYYKITLDTINDALIHSQLARPTGNDKLPALLILQWAGVYPLQKTWVTDRAAEGWLAMNLQPHDLPIDDPEPFYAEQYAGPLQNYWTIGNDDPDKSYYLQMYLSCVRAVQYLKSRDDWDGRTLVVMGTSQGGQQALATAGLCAGDVTALVAFLPAACDMLAPEIGRASGFPDWYGQTHAGKDPGKVRSASRYYDPANFARLIQCPVLIGAALRDDLAPPASVLAAANVITASKEVIILPTAGHQDENGSQKPFNDRAYGAWLVAMKSGQPPPIAQSAQEDHRRMMRLLGVEELRRGADADPDSPHAANSDESKAAHSYLPDPLKTNDGQPVTSAQQWRTVRRPEIVEHFDREVYGRVPDDVPSVHWSIIDDRSESVGGIPARIKRLIGKADNRQCPWIDVGIRLTLTTPTDANGPVPVIMELVFEWPGRPNENTDSVPGPDRWQLQVLKRGWGYATFIPTSVQADDGGGLTQGIVGLANRGRPRDLDDWGALRAWAWGASRALDYFETDPAVDARRVGIAGLSRYGKAALVAIAYDERFAIGFIASSGAGGAKLLRRDFGERVENLASSAEYHWFAGNFLKFAGPQTPADLPVDAHSLIALCAPRPVFISVGSPAVEGTWVDAKGMFLAGVEAGPVYELLGESGLPTRQFPPIETALITGAIAFRQHAGGHTAGPNWPTFLDFAETYLRPSEPSGSTK